MESVLTLGMGLVVAIGTVSAFSSYRSGVLDMAGERQVDIIEAELASAVYSLEGVESGELEVKLPEDIGGQGYQIVFDDGIKILVNNQEYVTELEHFSDKEFQGSVEGGPVKVFKSGDQFTLGAD